MFRKPKRNFRQRNTKNDSDEENNGNTDTFKTQETSGSSEISSHQTESAAKPVDKPRKVESASKKITKEKREKNPVNFPTGLPLSFDNEAEEEEECEVFKVKKSSYSRRMMKQLEKQRKKKTQDKEISPSLRIEDKIEGVSGKNNTEQFSFKAMVMNGDEVEEILDLDSGGAGDEMEMPSTDPFRKILESGSIPDAAMIHAARKRRQKAREMSEFISLDEPDTEKNNSRLIRDDDNDRSDDDDDEHGGRISFSAVKPPLAKDRAREAMLALAQKGLLNEMNTVNARIEQNLDYPRNLDIEFNRFDEFQRLF